MHHVLAATGDILLGLLVFAAWSALIFLAIAVIDALTSKRTSDAARRRQVMAKVQPLLSALRVCPGFALAASVYLSVVGPWLPSIFTLPPGTGIRPMGWAAMSWLLCGVVTYVGTPLASVDILRGVLPGRRSRASRVWGVALGVLGLAASLYASHLPHEVLTGVASWRGWVIEE